MSTLKRIRCRDCDRCLNLWSWNYDGTYEVPMVSKGRELDEVSSYLNQHVDHALVFEQV